MAKMMRIMNSNTVPAMHKVIYVMATIAIARAAANIIMWAVTML